MVSSQMYLAQYLALSKYAVNNCRLADQMNNYNFFSPLDSWSDLLESRHILPSSSVGFYTSLACKVPLQSLPRSAGGSYRGWFESEVHASFLPRRSGPASAIRFL